MTYRRLQGLPWQIIDDKAVIIDPSQQKVHELNEVGTVIWSQLTGELDTLDLQKSIAEEFDCAEAIVETDIQDFCEGLVAEGIVECLNPKSPF